MSESATVWQKWIAISLKASGLLLMILLYVSYFTIVLPFAVLFRVFADPLRRRLPGAAASGSSFFVVRARPSDTPETAAHPF